MDPELTAADQQTLDQKLKPYVDRIEQLEHNCQRKEMEVVILKLAFENMINQLSDLKDHVKKSKSSLTRPKVRQGTVVDQ
jgi:hypothetical protein